jgi:hypothetical protein
MLLVAVNALVGGMIGHERTVLPRRLRTRCPAGMLAPKRV